MVQPSDPGRSVLGQITQRATTPNFMVHGLGASFATHVMVFGGYSLYLLAAAWWANANLPEWMPPQSGVQSRPQVASQAIVIEAAFDEASEPEQRTAILPPMDRTAAPQAQPTALRRAPATQAPPAGHRNMEFLETVADRPLSDLPHQRRHTDQQAQPTEPPRPRAATVPKRGHALAVQPITSVASMAAQESDGAESDALPQKVFSPPPQYPPKSYAAKIGGRTKIRIELSPAGTVISASLYRSSGVSELDQAAIEAVRKWRFESSTPDRVTLRTFVVPIRFIPPP